MVVVAARFQIESVDDALRIVCSGWKQAAGMFWQPVVGARHLGLRGRRVRASGGGVWGGGWPGPADWAKSENMRGACSKPTRTCAPRTALTPGG
jgi:hypothetical protein